MLTACVRTAVPCSACPDAVEQWGLNSALEIHTDARYKPRTGEREKAALEAATADWADAGCNDGKVVAAFEVAGVGGRCRAFQETVQAATAAYSTATTARYDSLRLSGGSWAWCKNCADLEKKLPFTCATSSAAVFHDACDNKGPTAVVVR